MIQVSVIKNNGSYSSLTVTGHAYSGEAGNDLVCAGVSSILTGALNAFDSLTQDSLLTMDKQPLIKIELKTPSELNQKLFEFVLIQLKTVEMAHPHNIEIHEKEVKS